MRLAWIASSLTIAKGINITFDIVLDKLEQTVGNIAHIIVNVISVIYILAVIILGYILCINNTSHIPFTRCSNVDSKSCDTYWRDINGIRAN